MTGLEAAALGTAVLLAAGKILELGNNYYKANADWEQFHIQVDLLQEKLKFWESGTLNRNLSSGTAVSQCLSKAKSALEKEQAKLNKRSPSDVAKCMSLAGTILFPAKLGLRIQAAVQAFDNIPETLRLHEEGVAALDRVVKRRPFSELISSDSRYVPLRESAAKVYKALDNKGGPLVVLLHGGAGKGKTTLARSTVEYYGESNKSRFDHVLFLNCGPLATTETTLFELIQRLGYEPHANRKDEEMIRLVRIRNQVQSLLARKNILLILDDVPDGGEFLPSIIALCGSGVKCLVTSQLATVCQPLDRPKYVTIQIQDINEEDARMILASHIGLDNHEIPAHVQGVANEMIAKTGSNPLALATLANAIPLGRCNELKVWQKADADIFKALKSKVKGALFDCNYTGGFWSAMGLSMRRLSSEAQKLLLLRHACEGSSVPEEVIEVLYERSESEKDTGTFSEWGSELYNRQLVNISSQTNDLGIQSSWEMHSLIKRYIEEEMKEARDSIITSVIRKDSRIVGQSEEANDAWATTVCALYLEKELKERIISQMGIDVGRFNSLRRNAIEPITRLLGVPLSEGWTKTTRDCTRQMFTRYVCNGALDDSSITHLLSSSIAAPAMWRALKDICVIETILLDENNQGLMAAFADNLEEGVERSVQDETLQILFRLSFTERLNTNFILTSCPRVLEGLTSLLTRASKHERYKNPGASNRRFRFFGALTFLSLVKLNAGHGSASPFPISADDPFSPFSAPFWQMKSGDPFHPVSAPPLNTITCEPSDPLSAPPLKTITGDHFHPLSAPLLNTMTCVPIHPLPAPPLNTSPGAPFHDLSGPPLNTMTSVPVSRLSAPPLNIRTGVDRWNSNSSYDGYPQPSAPPGVGLHSGDFRVPRWGYANVVAQAATLDRPGFMSQVVKLFSKDTGVLLPQGFVVDVLDKLGRSYDLILRENILNQPWLLEEFVKALSDRPLPVEVATTIAALAFGCSEVTKNKIANHPRLVDELVMSLSRVTNLSFLRMAKIALRSLLDHARSQSRLDHARSQSQSDHARLALQVSELKLDLFK